MFKSLHYYVLSLSMQTNVLYEAFRDILIEVEDQGFPVTSSEPGTGPVEQEHQRELTSRVDRLFSNYFDAEPLGLVLVGSQEMQAAFLATTVHESAVIGRIDGDHTATDSRVLGQIAWPLVRESISGVQDWALSSLRDSVSKHTVTFGLEAVARATNPLELGTLLVEEDYRHHGSVSMIQCLPVLSEEVDVREVIDDAVDVVIERVLAADGNVVFMPPGSLRERERIVLLPRSPSV